MSAKRKKDATRPPLLTPEEIGMAEQLMETGKAQLAVDPHRQGEVVDATMDRRKETSGEEDSISFQLSMKEAILLQLWGYSGQTKDEGVKAEILESHDVLKKGLVALKILDVDRKKGSFRLNITRRAGYSAELLDQHINTPWVGLAIAELHGIRKEYLKYVNSLPVDPLQPSYFKVGRHGVKQLTGKTGPQIAMTFEEAPVEVEDYIEQAGLQVTQEDRERLLEGWGADLTVTQHSVLLAVLERMSARNYQGDGRAGHREVLTRAGVNPPGGTLPQLMKKALRNVKEYPVVRIYLHEVVELAGMDKDRQGDKQEVKQALEHLGAARYAFYWERAAFNEHKGRKKFAMDQDGRYVKEGVRAVGSILYVKEVVDPQSGQLDYYEIAPSEVFLDQVTEGYGSPGGYFLMMPTGLLEKVRKAVGPGRRVTPHYYTFLYWLLAKYEDRRSRAKNGKEPNLQIREHYEKIAQLIRMPESIWRRNRKNKALPRLESIYQAAKDLGYLKGYSMGADGIVTLELDPSGPFYRPKRGQELPPGADG